MRFLAPLFTFLTVAAFHTVLSASLEAEAKDEKAAKYDGLTELKKIDQMEFEAVQKNQAAHTNATEDQNGDSHYLEAAQDQSAEEHVDSENGNAAEGGGNSDAATQAESESESTEFTDGTQRQEHHEVVTKTAATLEENTQDSTKDQDVLE